MDAVPTNKGGEATRFFSRVAAQLLHFVTQVKGEEERRGLVANARQRLWNLISSPKPPYPLALSSLLARNSYFTPSSSLLASYPTSPFAPAPSFPLPPRYG